MYNATTYFGTLHLRLTTELKLGVKLKQIHAMLGFSSVEKLKVVFWSTFLNLWFSISIVKPYFSPTGNFVLVIYIDAKGLFLQCAPMRLV